MVIFEVKLHRLEKARVSLGSIHDFILEQFENMVPFHTAAIHCLNLIDCFSYAEGDAFAL